MRRLLAIALLILTTLTPAHAEEVVLGMSKDQVSITTSFDGSEILIFGAVKREEPIPGGGDDDLLHLVPESREAPLHVVGLPSGQEAATGADPDSTHR